jgi:outer membrane protein OmpA-like peptidoglycan-associated protein
MPSILPEVEEHASHEREFVAGPSNPMSQHAYNGPVKTQSRMGLVFGVTAAGLVLFLASIFGLWLLRSVRRLNRQVVHLNRQTEQLNQRLQSAEQHVKTLDEKASQAPAPAIAALRADQAPPQVPDQVPSQVKESEATAPAQAQLPSQSEAATQPASQAPQKTGQRRQQRDAELQKLKQSLGQIAETRRTADGVVMTLADKSLRFDSGKSAIAPQYRTGLNRVARVLMPIKGYAIYVYGYTDDSGTKDYNLQLSARRARAVQDALVKAGVDPSLISAKGFGKSKPLVSGSNPKARAANRRVEIEIVDSTAVSGTAGARHAAAQKSANLSKASVNR